VGLEKDAERGRLADDVLRNPVYVQSYGLIEQELMRKWRDSRDKDEREQLHQLIRMLDKARNVLESTMRSGKLAADDLSKRRTLAERIMPRMRAA